MTEATPDSLRLSWAVARGPFDSFVVQYQDTEGQPQALLVDGDQSKVHITGLEPETSYKFFLYGLREGMRYGPVSAEGTTGKARQITILVWARKGTREHPEVAATGKAGPQKSWGHYAALPLLPGQATEHLPPCLYSVTSPTFLTDGQVGWQK